MYRVGTGYDLHRLKKGRNLVIGGVKIPYEYGLEGHSDADVLLHAVIDAMLGAAGLRDIGYHFPPEDEQYRDISSLLLLGKVNALLEKEGYRVINLDAIMIAEAPKLAPFIEDMISNIAAELKINRRNVAVKATTTEGLGPCGRREAIAAQAVVLLRKQDSAGVQL